MNNAVIETGSQAAQSPTTATYVLLCLTIVSEVIATSALNASQGFTKWTAGTVAVIGYVITFYLLSLVMKTLPVGVVYAVWAGLGIALITIVGAVHFKQIPDAAAMVGIGLIVAGVLCISLLSQSFSH